MHRERCSTPYITHQACPGLQSSSVTAGATGIWQRIGSGWHVANLPASLKKVFSENVVVSKESVASGAVNLPLRLSFIGHEGCTHTIKDFQRIRADMRDRVSQVAFKLHPYMRLCYHCAVISGATCEAVLPGVACAGHGQYIRALSTLTACAGDRCSTGTGGSVSRRAQPYSLAQDHVSEAQCQGAMSSTQADGAQVHTSHTNATV